MDIRETLCELGLEDAVVLQDQSYDDAIIGHDGNGHVVYDYDKMVACLIQDGMDEEDAIDFINYNTIRALPYIDNAPIVVFGI